MNNLAPVIVNLIHRLRKQFMDSYPCAISDEFITISKIFTAPFSGDYLITCVGGGGAGGAASDATRAAATGGGAGGTRQCIAKMVAGDQVVCEIGAGGQSVYLSGVGGSGGKSKVTLPNGEIMEGFGGSGGKFTSTIGVDLLTAAGGGSQGAGWGFTGGNGGSVPLLDSSSRFFASGGGAAGVLVNGLSAPDNKSTTGGATNGAGISILDTMIANHLGAGTLLLSATLREIITNVVVGNGSTGLEANKVTKFCGGGGLLNTSGYTRSAGDGSWGGGGGGAARDTDYNGSFINSGSGGSGVVIIQYIDRGWR